MPTYTYRAVNEDGKEVHGSLDAPDTITAKSAIEQLHLELIDLTEAMRLKQPPAQTNAGVSYAFEGTDSSGTRHRGSVQAASKREAFENLHHVQGLRLAVLTPVGTSAPVQDAELEQWQVQENGVVQQSAGFSAAAPVIAATVAQQQNGAGIAEPVSVEKKYTSLFATLRLYAGWLLAWYGLFVACGYYTYVRQLPVEIPAAEGFFFSPLILSFILAIFLYLVLHSIHRALSGKLILGGALSVIGVMLFVFLRMNLV